MKEREGRRLIFGGVGSKENQLAISWATNGKHNRQMLAGHIRILILTIITNIKGFPPLTLNHL